MSYTEEGDFAAAQVTGEAEMRTDLPDEIDLSPVDEDELMIGQNFKQ